MMYTAPAIDDSATSSANTTNDLWRQGDRVEECYEAGRGITLLSAFDIDESNGDSFN